MLIAIFVLLLIGVVAIALIISSGTETALAGNYRSSTSVYYAAVAGLEEARARLRAHNPNSFQKTTSNFLPPPGTPLPVCAPVYVINPLGSENVAPWDFTNKYFDKQFSQEFSVACSGGSVLPPNPSPSTYSVWSPLNSTSPLNGLPFPSPLYKWVRINGLSEVSLNLNTYPYADSSIDQGLLYYDGSHITDVSSGNPQVLEVTALAVLPNGSQKLLQYLVAPSPITLPPFLAALTLSGGPGNSPVFQAPAKNPVFAVKGDDQCNPTGPKFAAIGLFGNYSGNYGADLNGIISGIPNNVNGTNTQLNYTGLGPAPPMTNPPDVEYLATYPTNMQTPSQLDAIAQSIIQSADAFVPAGSNSTQTAYLTSLGMSPSNILTVVANGDLDLSGWTGTGYGLLLVTGTFTYDPSTTWNGIILVIGKGAVAGYHLEYKQINGAMFVAQTGPHSSLLSALGGAYVKFDDDMQGNGIRYDSCWIQKAQPSPGYKVLSFHEISQ